MANNRELSEFGGFVSVNNTDRTVGIATSVRVTTGGIFVGGVQAIRPDGTWGGSSAGIQGAQGTGGVQGTTGTQGTTGAQGTTGTQGITGTQGATGSQGTTGAQGATGTQGTTGVQGVQGRQGITGTQGATGTQGTQGITGPTGGSSGQVLYNSGGTATSSSNLTFDGTNLVCGGTIRASNTSIDPSNVGAGFAAGNIFETSTGFSAPGICFGTGAGQHGAIVYGSGTMYFGSENGSDNTMATLATLTNNGNFSFNSGYGSNAVAYGVRAWVRKNNGFDGLGNGIMGSANVTSLTQQATGRWTVNLTNAMPDTNYAVVATSFRNNSDSFENEDPTVRSTTTFTICLMNYSGSRYDFGFSAAVIR